MRGELERSVGFGRLRHTQIQLLMAAAMLFGATGSAAAALLIKSDATYAASLAADDIALTGIAVITNPAALDAVTDRIRAMGGAVTFSDQQTGFLAAVVRRVDLGRLQQDAQITALALEHLTRELVGHSGAAPARQSADKKTPKLGWQQRVARDRADFLRDLGATQFAHDHPNWDGRGVTIAHVENAPDFLAPELQFGTTLDGKPVAKFRTITSFEDSEPRLDGRTIPAGRDAWQRVALSEPVRAVDGSIAIAACRFRVPSDEEFRVSTIAIPAEITGVLGMVAASCLGADRFGVLWSESQGRAWIDSNADLDFRDEHAVGDFAATSQFGSLSAAGGFQGRHAIGFALHREGNDLRFTFGTSSHATGVAGFAAGSLGRSGQVQGVAPGADFVLIAHGNTASTFARALIMAFAGPADIVLLESQYPTLGSDTDRSEGTVMDLLIGRLVDLYKKPCFITGGNEPGLGSVLDPTPANAVVIGAWQSRRATRMHLGFDMTVERALHWATSEGPTGQGNLKPDVLAPVLHYVASTAFEQDSGHGRIEEIPAGYQVFLGTSGATPVAAGAAALLISAAKQSGMRVDHTEIARALRSSARFMPGVAAVRQGTGTIDVGKAWMYLVDHLAEPQIEFRVEAPVETATSRSLPNPNLGGGLFVREGVALGKPIERCIKVTRISGQRELAPFSLTWVGDAERRGDGRTFTAPASISLPLNTTVCIPIRIAPFDVGVHSSILEVRIPSQPNSVARRIPVTVVIPYELDAGHSFHASGQLPLSRPGRAEIFFRVLPGMDALNVNIRGIGISGVASKGALLYAYLRSPQGEPVSQEALGGSATKRTVSIYRPAPGVWAMCAINYGNQVMPGTSAPKQRRPEAVSFQVTATRVGTELAPDASHLNAENVGAGVLGSIRPVALGMRSITPGSLSKGEQSVIPVFVPAKVELLVLDLSTAVTSTGPLDLLLFDCADGHCQLSRESRGVTSTKRLVLRQPKGGQWRIVVDGTYATQLKTDFSVETVFISSSYGEVATDDSINRRDTGAKWNASVRPKLRKAIPANARSVLPIYFDDLINGSLHDFKSPKTQFGEEDHREPAPLGLRIVELDSDGHGSSGRDQESGGQRLSWP